MNLQNDPQSFALMKFAIGQPVPRSEDPTLVRGEGCYTDDIKLAGEAYAVIVRSRVPHGVIKGIETSAARNMPGVLLVNRWTHLERSAVHQTNDRRAEPAETVQRHLKNCVELPQGKKLTCTDHDQRKGECQAKRQQARLVNPAQQMARRVDVSE